MKSERLTKNFYRDEFACKCGCGLDEINLSLVKILQFIRDYVGRPIHILSGCRCEKHNSSKDVGGKEYSRHLPPICDAADIYIAGMGVYEMAWIADQSLDGGGGIGVYPSDGHIHIDIRPVRWRG